VGPELEYSDDEDFESTEDIISGSQYKQGMVQGDGPYPPAYGTRTLSAIRIVRIRLLAVVLTYTDCHRCRVVTSHIFALLLMSYLPR
jgi:hypothetical protein